MADVSYAKINNRTWDLLDKETKEQCLSVESLNMPLEDIPSEQELQNTFVRLMPIDDFSLTNTLDALLLNSWHKKELKFSVIFCMQH